MFTVSSLICGFPFSHVYVTVPVRLLFALCRSKELSVVWLCIVFTWFCSRVSFTTHWNVWLSTHVAVTVIEAVVFIVAGTCEFCDSVTTFVYRSSNAPCTFTAGDPEAVLLNVTDVAGIDTVLGWYPVVGTNLTSTMLHWASIILSTLNCHVWLFLLHLSAYCLQSAQIARVKKYHTSDWLKNCQTTASIL